MSEDNQVDTMCCASRGIPECDVIKLKECTACDLVRYCSDACQENHKSQHEEACKKRAAELRDELLFNQLAECDEIKLKECATCDLVRYCSDECQENHTSQHKEACMKRAVELRDEILFKQPENSYLGDCPICCLPMPLDLSKSIVAVCCSKSICRGCDVETQKREFGEGLDPSCPFCREPVGNELWREQIMK